MDKLQTAHFSFSFVAYKFFHALGMGPIFATEIEVRCEYENAEYNIKSNC